ncbi:MAG: group II truncated hemoglobin [Gammaproteobacteria bacterium]|nr:group II truncated hemoglobin [Gammaproteobacteria bacterium]MCY4218219.1 group II truncated hemoglobin [Gammaproteobacteria bacterium]MCY4274855.1 group II truncated hemoglobin [Gammaproteobacteria bacterium]
MPVKPKEYGKGDNSYRAAGGTRGIYKLVDRFFDYMDHLPEARKIREMHPQKLDESRDKLARFLCGWLGGPKIYQEKYGPISIPGVHQHLEIAVSERDAWLKCMSLALEEQPYDPDFRSYLIQQLSIPAERIRTVCQLRNNEDSDSDCKN